MRSVIRKPLTMLVVDAKTAMAPSTVLSRDSCSPASRMAPTTAIAEIALVSDISGVCSSRETRRMTSRPMNVASISTNKPSIKSNCIGRKCYLSPRSSRFSIETSACSGSGSSSRSPARPCRRRRILWHVSLLVPAGTPADRARHGRPRAADADHVLLDRGRHAWPTPPIAAG